MPSVHDDKEFPGAAYRRGNPGDTRQGTVYGYRSARDYNRVKIRATEQEEGRPVVLFHYARRLKNDNRICEFVVANGHLDPGMKVYSRVPRPVFVPAALAGNPVQGTVHSPQADVLQEWVRTEEEGKYVFHAPDSYVEGPILWLHDPNLLDESLVYEQTTNYFFLPTAAPQADAGPTEVAS